jgi:diaminopimelate epimerase
MSDNASLKFTKYHANGNDFIITNDDMQFSEQQIRLMCNRHFGIGADGFIVIKQCDTADFYFDFFNNDGKRASMCGNGAICAVKATAELLKKNNLFFIAPDGQHNATITNHTIEITMNIIPNFTITDNYFIIDTGVPHVVRFVDYDLKCLTCENNEEMLNYLKRDAKNIRQKEDANVNFIDANDFLLTFERGVEDFTLSCGTGTVATAIAIALKEELVDAQQQANENLYHIESRGGILTVSFDRNGCQFTNIRLSGQATKVFDGIWRQE